MAVPYKIPICLSQYMGEQEIVPPSEKKKLKILKKLKYFKKLIFFKNFKTLLFKKNMKKMQL